MQFFHHGANRLGSICIDARSRRWLFRHTLYHRYLFIERDSYSQYKYQSPGFRPGSRMSKIASIICFLSKEINPWNHSTVHWERSCGSIAAWHVTQKVQSMHGKKYANYVDTFWKDVFVPGTANEFNLELDKANRVADFMELGEMMVVDALERNESWRRSFPRRIPGCRRRSFTSR